jgi:hypothetical protein
MAALAPNGAAWRRRARSRTVGCPPGERNGTAIRRVASTASPAAKMWAHRNVATPPRSAAAAKMDAVPADAAVNSARATRSYRARPASAARYGQLRVPTRRCGRQPDEREGTACLGAVRRRPDEDRDPDQQGLGDLPPPPPRPGVRLPGEVRVTIVLIPRLGSSPRSPPAPWRRGGPEPVAPRLRARITELARLRTILRPGEQEHDGDPPEGDAHGDVA